MEYNGHPSYDHWNVTLWLFNEEYAYNIMRQLCRTSRTLDDAALQIMDCMPEKTLDGVKFTQDLVAYAIKDEWDEIQEEMESED